MTRVGRIGYSAPFESEARIGTRVRLVESRAFVTLDLPA